MALGDCGFILALNVQPLQLGQVIIYRTRATAAYCVERCTTRTYCISGFIKYLINFQYNKNRTHFTLYHSEEEFFNFDILFIFTVRSFSCFKNTLNLYIYILHVIHLHHSLLCKYQYSFSSITRSIKDLYITIGPDYYNYLYEYYSLIILSSIEYINF